MIISLAAHSARPLLSPPPMWEDWPDRAVFVQGVKIGVTQPVRQINWSAEASFRMRRYIAAMAPRG
jgi:hypothetical protein